jgi:hypothetical protein
MTQMQAYVPFSSQNYIISVFIEDIHFGIETNDPCLIINNIASLKNIKSIQIFFLFFPKMLLRFAIFHDPNL